MELKRPFGIDELLGPATARAHLRPLQRAAGRGRLHHHGPARGQFKVAVVCTTDDPADTLAAHAAAGAHAHDPVTARLSRPGGPTRPWPSTTRPPGTRWVEQAGEGGGHFDRRASVRSWRRSTVATRPSTTTAAAPPITASRPCAAVPYSRRRRRARPSTACAAGRTLEPGDAARLQVGAPPPPGRSWTTQRGWVQQFHLGALRNNNTRLTGGSWARTAGCDSIGDFETGAPAARASSTRLDADGSARQDHPLQPEPARQRALRHHGRQLPGRHRCRARCSTAPPGGSSTRRTAWRRRSNALSNMGLSRASWG